MTTPASDTQEWTADRFLEHARQTIESMALLYAGTPEQAMEASLMKFAAELRTGWGATAKDVPGMSEANFASVVDDVVSRIRLRRQEIEAAGAFGRA